MSVAHSDYFSFVIENSRFKYDFIAIVIELHDFRDNAAAGASCSKGYYALSGFSILFAFKVDILNFFVPINNLFE